MKKLNLIPLLDPCDWNDTYIDDEFADKEISTHYRGETFKVWWDDEEDFPALKVWLIETYGEEIKQYDKFAIDPT